MKKLLFLTVFFPLVGFSYQPRVGDKAIYSFTVKDSNGRNAGSYQWEVVSLSAGEMTLRYSWALPGYQREVERTFSDGAFGSEEDIEQVLQTCEDVDQWNGKIEYLALGREELFKVCTYSEGGTSSSSVGHGVPGGLLRHVVKKDGVYNITLFREFVRNL